MRSVRSFFVERVDANLPSEARRHPLGFLVVSEPLADGLLLRYHVWPADWTLPKGQEGGETHDHSYELNSLVVLGSLRQYTFRPRFDIRGGHDVLEVDYTPAGSVLRRTGLRVHLEAETDETFGVGMAYRLASGTVHRVEAVGRPTATLVLSVPAPGAIAPRVFVPSDQDAPGEFVRDRLDAGELSAAREAISGLRGSRGA
jgi:hypothetical protein